VAGQKENYHTALRQFIAAPGGLKNLPHPIDALSLKYLAARLRFWGETFKVK
jgi:hypothetical protein